MTETAPERAQGFRQELVEVLKTLNWGEEEEPGHGGVEPSEILLRLQRGPYPALTEGALDEALATLLANGMIETRDDSEYAWDRQRDLGRRYALTVPGKQFLLLQLERKERIG